MPEMSKIHANPDYKPTTDAEKATFAEIKKRHPFELPYVVAMDNITASKGMYALVTDERSVPAPQGQLAKSLEDMTAEELKLTMLQAGVQFVKGMKKADVIAAIREKLAAMDMGEDQ